MSTGRDPWRRGLHVFWQVDELAGGQLQARPSAPNPLADYYDDATVAEIEADANDGQLGPRIREAREAIGLSQLQLASRLGVKESTVKRWETDQVAPRANRLASLAGITGVSLSWLLIGHGVEPSTEEVAIAETRQELADLSRQLAVVVERIDHLNQRLAERG